MTGDTLFPPSEEFPPDPPIVDPTAGIKKEWLSELKNAFAESVWEDIRDWQQDIGVLSRLKEEFKPTDAVYQQCRDAINLEMRKIEELYGGLKEWQI